MKLKFKSIALSLLICLTAINVSALEQVKNVSSSKLTEVYNKINDTDSIPVAIWLDNIDYEEVENQIKNKTKSLGINHMLYSDSFVNELSENNIKSIPHNVMKEYKSIRTSTYRRIISKSNSDFVDSNLKDSKIIFSSKLVPLVIANVNKNCLEQLLSKNDIKKMDLFVNKKGYSSSDISLPTQGFNPNTVRTGVFSGVSVGVLEAEGYANESTVISFIGSMAFYNASSREAAQNVSDHATVVCSQIAQIVPDANLVQCYAPDSETYMEGAEGLIQYDCDVINSSMFFPSSGDLLDGTAECDGTYQLEDEFIDYLSYTYKTIFVTAAGNIKANEIEGSEFIHTPALAYNGITVGAFDDKNTLYRTDDTIYEYSSYGFHPSLAQKPDIYASGVNIDIVGFRNTGTSFAAPYVTAAVALILQDYPGYASAPPLLKSILISSAKTVQGLHFLDVPDLNSKVICVAGIGDRSGKYYLINVNNSDINKKMKLAFSWERSTTYNDNPTLVNYNIKVTDPDGNIVARSNSLTNNSEVVEFLTTIEGRYRVDISRTGSFTPDPTYGMSAFYID